MSVGMQPIHHGIEKFQGIKKGSTPDKRKKGDKQKKFSWFLNEKEGEGEIQKKTAQRRTGDLLKENNNTATIDRRYVSDGTCGTLINAEV